MKWSDALKFTLQYTHAQAFVGSSLLAFVLFLLTSLFGLDKLVAASFSTFGGLMSFLMFERVFVSDRIGAAEKTILQSLQNRIYAKRFKNAAEALDYVTENALACEKILNTRLKSHTSVASLGFVKDATDRHDRAIASAVALGCNVRFIVSCEALSDLGVFTNFPPLGTATMGKGNFLLHVLNTHDQPLLQMNLLFFRDGRREALIGWDLAQRKRADQPVLHLREYENYSTVSYFEELFEHYEMCGEGIISLEQFDRLRTKKPAPS